MSTFNITSSQKNKTFVYENENLIVQGQIQQSDPAEELQSINAQAYRNDDGKQGAYVANINGYLRDGEMRYSLSDMSRRDSMLVWDAIDEIEAYINGANE